MKCKRETDGRRLGEAGQEAIRLQAVKSVVNGLSPEQEVKNLGINRRTSYGWLEKYHCGGLEALKCKPRPGVKPKLSAEQLVSLCTVDARTRTGADSPAICCLAF